MPCSSHLYKALGNNSTKYHVLDTFLVPIIINIYFTFFTFYFTSSLSSYEVVIITHSIQMMKQRLGEIFKLFPLSLPHLFCILQFFFFLIQKLVVEEVKLSPNSLYPHSLKTSPQTFSILRVFKLICYDRALCRHKNNSQAYFNRYFKTFLRGLVPSE